MNKKNQEIEENVLWIYGSSDDLVEIEGEIVDEFYCREQEYGQIKVNDDFMVLIGYGIPLKKPTWSIQIQPLDHGVYLSDYDISIDSQHSYSPYIKIETEKEINIETKKLRK